MIQDLPSLAAHFGAAPTLKALNERIRKERGEQFQIVLQGTDGTWLEPSHLETPPPGFVLKLLEIQKVLDAETHGHSRTIKVPISSQELDEQLDKYFDELEAMAAYIEEYDPSDNNRLSSDQMLAVNALLADVAEAMAEKRRELLDSGMTDEEMDKEIRPFQQKHLTAAIHSAHEDLEIPSELLMENKQWISMQYTLRLVGAGFSFEDAIEQSTLEELFEL